MVQQSMDARHPGGGSKLPAYSKLTGHLPHQDATQLDMQANQFVLQVVVASKFDNRLKEFAERWEVDRYLSATGYLHPNAKPFFVALPKVSCTSACASKQLLFSTQTVRLAACKSWLDTRPVCHRIAA